MPGSQTVRKAGVTPARDANQVTPAAISSAPGAAAAPGPKRREIRADCPEHSAAITGAGVTASPASIIDSRQIAVRNRTLQRIAA